MYVDAYNKRIDKVAWLNGVYTFDALSCAISNVFLKKGDKPHTYTEKPYVQSKKSITPTNVKQELNDILCECY